MFGMSLHLKRLVWKLAQREPCFQRCLVESRFEVEVPLEVNDELTGFPVMTTIPIIPVWIIKITRILQYFPATKVKSAAIEVSAGL